MRASATGKRDDSRWRRPARVAVSFFAVVLLVTLVAWWPWVVAQARALAVLGSVLEVPVLEPVVSAVTREPTVDEGAQVAAVATTVFRPGGEGPWPAVLFLTGADGSGRRHPDVVRLGEGLARAGFLVVVPDLPGMREGRLGDETIEAGRRVAAAVARMEDARAEQVALASVSAGASIALIVAADDDVEPHVSVIAGIAPYADVRTVVEIATTGTYQHDDGRVERFDTTEWMQTAVARSLFEATDGPPRAEALEEQLLERDNPIEAARRLPAAEVRTADETGALALLREQDAKGFDARYDALPRSVRDEMAVLSPRRHVGELDVPIELAAPPKDKYFPLAESRTIVDAAPDARLTVTATLEHAIPTGSADGLGDLAAFNGFVVRVLRTAAADDG